MKPIIALLFFTNLLVLVSITSSKETITELDWLADKELFEKFKAEKKESPEKYLQDLASGLQYEEQQLDELSQEASGIQFFERISHALGNQTADDAYKHWQNIVKENPDMIKRAREGFHQVYNLDKIIDTFTYEEYVKAVMGTVYPEAILKFYNKLNEIFP